ncbi:hypothetical protein HNQ94_003574 [Salirhabdus euzebyi]|uniref:Cardiolipin synthase N-terminal domain-containing protein n=1 Tax=Salirhabdus euzebyi TaxID=394506 RepID=A0A841Q8W0_9BACI|nr:PLD nuclease N-terminal domain-containing protein [Salirhabdus euzebyi]MBB6455079.1 hypothetical protein [Salirhabdus euzebyi]
MWEELAALNWALIAPLLVIELILIVVALIDLSRIEKANGPKWAWVLIILFVTGIGPIIYFIFGRRQ